MKKVSVSELKNRLSQYLRLVKSGETIEVLEHSVPIAHLSGLPKTLESEDAYLERLVREGIVTPAQHRSGPRRPLKPPIPCPVDIVRLLCEDRDRE